jgi:hypothetical protein
LVDFDRERHQYRRFGVIVPHVTAIIAAIAFSRRFVDEETRQRSLARGTSVHWMTQLEDQHALDYRRVPKGLRPYRKAWLAWKRASGFVPLWIERQFACSYGFAGTLDRFGKFSSGSTFRSGSLGVVDIKTGPIPEFTRLQLAAYCLAVDERFAIARTIRRVAVHLKANGTYNVREWLRSSWDQDIAEFLQAVKDGRENGARAQR